MVVGLIAPVTRSACKNLVAPVFLRASKWTFSPYLCWAQTGLEAIMALYEFRLLDADGKVIVTRQCECATMHEAISVGTTFSASYRFVEIWLDGRVIGRMPKG